MAHIAHRSRWGLLVGLVLLTLISDGWSLRPGEAATTIVVTSLADPGNGTCTKAACTLREALAAAQAGDRITFDPALFTQGPCTITLTAGELVIDKDLRLTGPGSRQLAIHGNGASRVVRIPAGAVVTIEKVTIQGGYDEHGGGLHNDGTLTLRQSTVSGNTADYYGGGLYNSSGTLTLVQSTVSDNTTRGGGGGLLNYYGTLTLQRSTVSGNTAASKAGGGLWNAHGTLTLIQSTVSGNTARYGGGLYTSPDHSVSVLYKTIVAGNTASKAGSDCFHASQVGTDPTQSWGYNLTGAGTGCLTDAAQVGDLTVEPAVVFTEVLGSLRDNGGATWTHALLPGSPAIYASDSDHCIRPDQRGVPRPQGDACDIGAFELEQE
jgi:CSLREA domain-containing protein